MDTKPGKEEVSAHRVWAGTKYISIIKSAFSLAGLLVDKVPRTFREKGKGGLGETFSSNWTKLEER